MESLGCLDWEFQFWNLEDQCRIRQKFEVMNPVIERIYVIPMEDDINAGQFKRRRLDVVEENASNEFQHNPSTDFPNQWIEELGCDVGGEAVDAAAVELEVKSEVPNHLTSTLLSDEVMQKYNGVVLKLKKDLENLDMADHDWYLKPTI